MNNSLHVSWSKSYPDSSNLPMFEKKKRCDKNETNWKMVFDWKRIGLVSCFKTYVCLLSLKICLKNDSSLQQRDKIITQNVWILKKCLYQKGKVAHYLVTGICGRLKSLTRFCFKGFFWSHYNPSQNILAFLVISSFFKIWSSSENVDFGLSVKWHWIFQFGRGL